MSVTKSVSVSIFGQENCPRCEEVKALIPDARYADVDRLLDTYPTEAALTITTATGGKLPIVVIESAKGLIALSVGEVIGK